MILLGDQAVSSLKLGRIRRENLKTFENVKKPLPGGGGREENWQRLREYSAILISLVRTAPFIVRSSAVNQPPDTILESFRCRSVCLFVFA